MADIEIETRIEDFKGNVTKFLENTDNWDKIKMMVFQNGAFVGVLIKDTYPKELAEKIFALIQEYESKSGSN